MKNFTTSAVTGRGHSELHPQPFRFGAESDTSLANYLSPGECFMSTSPPQDSRPHSATNQPTPIPFGARSRPQFAGIGGPSGSRHGSPLHCQPRRSSNPFLRNRKQFRRSLSMFEHPADIMKPKSNADEPGPSLLRSVMDIEEPREPQLPHIMPDDPTDCIPRISKQTLLDVLDGKYIDAFDQKMIIDCRFEYEYDGGHIDGAVNYNDKELLSSQLFQAPMGGRTLLIFHCEYSVHRAPLMARHVRSEDRTTNAEHYPRLTYPEVYILEGGYSSFFSEHRGRCYPPAYVEMSDEKHQRTCEREMGRLKARKGLGRSQTFAFGQREPCVNDSPTASGRPSSRQSPVDMLGYSPILGDRAHTRRMASY
jgi:M-phase inducer tyrosine phosphatase